MRLKFHNTIATILVLVLGVALLYFGTDGFKAFTMETARVNQLMKEKPVFPAVMMEDSKERKYDIAEFEDKHVLITFIYTACTTVCIELERNMAEVYSLIPSEYIGEDIVFLSISFDPTRDDPERLEKYRTYFNSDGETWRMARIPNQGELDSLLKEFGVIVIPDDYGDFAHNSAFYFVDQTGRLLDVMDYKKIDEAAAKIISVIEQDGGEKL